MRRRPIVAGTPVSEALSGSSLPRASVRSFSPFKTIYFLSSAMAPVTGGRPRARGRPRSPLCSGSVGDEHLTRVPFASLIDPLEVNPLASPLRPDRGNLLDRLENKDGPTRVRRRKLLGGGSSDEVREHLFGRLGAASRQLIQEPSGIGRKMKEGATSPTEVSGSARRRGEGRGSRWVSMRA